MTRPRILTTFALAILLAATGRRSRAADWPQFRADAARSGHTAEGLPPDLNLHWSYKLPHAPMPAWPEPGWERNRLAFDVADHVVASGGQVFFGSSADGAVRALDARTGRLKWTFLTGGPVRFAPALWRDRVLVASDDGSLYCLSAESGKRLWEFYGGPRRQSILGNGRMISRWPARGGPVVADDRVYFSVGIFPTQGAFVYALDPANGDVIWVNDTACLNYQDIGMPSGNSFNGVAGQGYLVAHGDKLLVPTGRGLPGGFERQTGKLAFYGCRASSRAGGCWVAGLDQWFVCADKAYDLDGGAMRCVDLGNLDRSFGTASQHSQRDRIPPGHAARELAVTPDWVLVATGTQVKMVKRSELWLAGAGENPPRDDFLGRDQLAELKRLRFTAAVDVPCDGGLIAAGQVAYAGSKDRVSAIRLDGQPKVIWTAAVEGIAYGLAVADGRLLVSTSAGVLYSFAPGKADTPIKNVEKPEQDPYGGKDPLVEQAAEEIVKMPGVRKGYCFDLGCGDGRLAYELARRTDLFIYAVDSDVKNVQAARQALFRAGLYGVRVAVDHAPSLAATAAPSHFAELVVSGRSVREGPQVVPKAEAMRTARPYGGMVLRGKPGAVQKDVRGPLEGAGRWTHQYADAGNTCCSGDALAKSPLRVLWFGSPGQRGLPHGWGRPPAPLVVDGRMFILGDDFIRCTDVYNGRVHWETPIPGIASPYSSPHYAGTYLVGSNWCASAAAGTRYSGSRYSGSVFVHDGQQCYRLSAIDGAILAKYKVPEAACEGGASGRWGYVACVEGLLLGTCEGTPFDVEGVIGFTGAKRTQGRALFALEPATGALKWVYRAKRQILRDTIAAAAGKVFFIDRPPGPSPSAGELVALDAKTGKVAWKADQDIFGNCLVASAEHDAVLMAFPAPPGSPIRSLAEDVIGDRMAVFHATTGKKLWDRPVLHALRPVLMDRTVVSQCISGDSVRNKKDRSPASELELQAKAGKLQFTYPFFPDALDLLTGEPVMRNHPVDGAPEPWTFGNLQRCGLVSASKHLMLFRTSDLTYYDFSRQEGLGNFGSYRPGCWINIIPAGGLVLAPDSWSACFCAHQNRTTVALEPAELGESWGIVSARKTQAGTIARVGLNFAAPGDRRDAAGTLWLAMPRPYSRTPYWFPKVLDIGQAVSVQGGTPYRRYADRQPIHASSSADWLLASGLEGPVVVSVNTRRMPADTSYTLRLHFVEPQPLKTGQRVFEVKINGQVALADVDVVRETGGPWTGLVKECRATQPSSGSLTVELVAKTGQPILSALEIVPLPPGATK